jgi:YspA, cpYpsA-related SLOG family
VRVLVCGDREWTDRPLMESVIRALREKHGSELVIIEGDCRGADKMAGSIAADLDLEVLKFPAEWSKYGGAAGPIRNQQMIDEGRPKLGIAFHNDLAHSKGTKDMVKRLKAHKITVLHAYSGAESPVPL